MNSLRQLLVDQFCQVVGGPLGGNVNISGARISEGGSPFVLVQGIPVAITSGGRIELGSVMQGKGCLQKSYMN